MSTMSSENLSGPKFEEIFKEKIEYYLSNTSNERLFYICLLINIFGRMYKKLTSKFGVPFPNFNRLLARNLTLTNLNW
jgi:hypothetical protein